MDVRRRPAAWRWLLVGVTCLLGLVAVTPRPATAAIVACRTDPIVLLSNGMVVRVTVKIADTADNVEHITYVLRAPRGTRVVNLVYTGGALLGKETLIFVADQRRGRYVAATHVETVAGIVPVRTFMQVNSFKASATGTSASKLVTQIQLPS